MSNKIINAPKEIYLNLFLECEGEEVDFKDLEGVCWSDVAEEKDAIKYVCSDIHNKTLAELERVKKENQKLREALKEALEQIADDAEVIDAEWGNLRSFDKILADGSAPEAYVKAKELLNPKENE